MLNNTTRFINYNTINYTINGLQFFSVFAIVCTINLLISIVVCKSESTIDWNRVKPMFIVSMYPKPNDLESKHPYSMISMDSTKNNDNNLEPGVMNLEATPMNENMLPGGIKAMDRIFGGNKAYPNCFPYQVGLLLQRPKGLYWCGGSLISNAYILTAAHCVDMAKRALIFLGAHEIKNSKEIGQQRIMVTHDDFIIYPTWNPRRLKDDIALVHLPNDIDFTSRIHPITLPKRSYEHRHFRNKMAIASGWGRYATGVHAISNELRFVKLQIVDGKTCKRNFPLSYRRTNICTSGKFSRSTCNGDSGGPLVLRRRKSKKRVLIGITSFGSIFGCDRGYPAAFTKVASYLDWINDETGIEPYQDTSNAMVFTKYIKEYQNKYNKENIQKGRRFEWKYPYIDEDDSSIGTINVNYKDHPDANLFLAEFEPVNKYHSYQITDI